ncbi:phosphate acyltransferase PlsX [Anaerovoracaceae bacterium 41-7]|uniref:phosphate acyltransferase PlsX n=1 Tax=Senimuribacter intestinalis TaxID=2941507 RepID=UPI00203C2645|nr:phosphate acyltransferase PlsX [Senimuribacter intestinalis]
MRILLDGMGGDHAPEVIVEGAVAAAKEIKDKITIIGHEDKIRACLAKYGTISEKIEVIDASEEITNDEAPVKAVRTKKDSSIVKGLNLVKNKEADVFLSAGSTGALLAGGLFILGRIQGIDRPTLATVYPVIGMQPSLLVDTGANAECKPGNLLEFATMGSIYMEKVLKRENPTVGLVNNGTEEGKGTTLTKAAYELLSKSNLNFIGSIEARSLQDGICDIIVTDGFTGNAIIKLTEGMGLMVLREMKRRFLSTTKSKLGAVLLKDQLSEIKKEFNYAEYGGAPLLGVKGALLKMHGSSDALAVKQTIMKAIPYVEENVVDTIQNSVLEIEEILISE